MSELEFLQKKCLFILDFFSSTIQKPDPILLEMKNIVKNGFVKKNLKGLRMCERDLKEWANGLDKEQKEELEKRLQENNLHSNFINIDDLIKRGKN